MKKGIPSINLSWWNIYKYDKIILEKRYIIIAFDDINLRQKW